MQSQHKGRSIKATKPLSTRSNGKTVANREGQRKKTMVKDTPTAPPAPYAVVTKRGVCTLTNMNRFM